MRIARSSASFIVSVAKSMFRVGLIVVSCASMLDEHVEDLRSRGFAAAIIFS